MFLEQFQSGGPVMWVVFAAWIIVAAGILDRILYGVGRLLRRPLRKAVGLARSGDRSAVSLSIECERQRAERGLARIDGVSQLATSIGLFGTVLGITQAFFARSGGGLSAPDLLSAGLATALYTTIAGLIVFLVGQAFLIAYGEWLSVCEQRTTRLFEEVDSG